MLDLSSKAGLNDDLLLADDKAGPNVVEFEEFFAVCTDDVMHWARDPRASEERLKLLGDVWHAAGVPSKAAKNIDWQTHGAALGCEFDGHKGILEPAVSKQWVAMRASMEILQRKEVSPQDVQANMGSLQWFDLLVRAKLACYDKIYDFCRAENSNVPRVLPGDCKSELLLSISLAPLWSVNLDREHVPFISATDASTEFGFGVCTASASIDTIRHVAGLAEKRGDFVLLRNENVDSTKIAKQRLGKPTRLKLSKSSFRTILSVRAQHKAHIGVLEAEALLLWLRWLLRTPKHHRCRATCLVDSKVVLGCVSKGRSSSQPLLRVLRRISALVLVSDVLLRLVYIPTEENPSDSPSRGIRVRPSIRRSHLKAKRPPQKSKLNKYFDELDASWKHLKASGMLSSGDSSSVLLSSDDSSC